jgi:phosphoglycerate dehydrogenase-like enzyme
MNVQAWSPHLTPERAKEAGVTFATKEELFRTSDIISIHIVSSPSTLDLVTSKEFALMKPTAFLVNTSRGPIVNEEALLKALNEERIAGAGLDVYNVEPLPLDSPIRSAKNATLTPHMGYVGDTLYKVCTLSTFANKFYQG